MQLGRALRCVRRRLSAIADPPLADLWSLFMKKRMHVNKHASASKFRRHSSRTNAVNMRGAPMRGGIRL